MGLLLIIAVILLILEIVTMAKDEYSGESGIFYCAVIFILIWVIVFSIGWCMGQGTVSRLISFYENNKNIQEKIVKQFNKLSVVNNNYGDKTIINVDNLKQSTNASNMIEQYLEDVKDYNNKLIYGRKIRQGKFNWFIFGPLPTIPDNLKTLDINL
jgi:hypothetical protein